MIITAASACAVFLFTDAAALTKRFSANKAMAEFLCTSGRSLSALDGRFPENSRLSSRLQALGAKLYWASELKARNERAPEYNPLGGGAALLIFSALLLVALRPVSAGFGTLLVIAAVVHLSKLKFKYLQMNLHAYDFVYSFNASDVAFFLKTYRGVAVGILAKAAIGIIALLALAECEPVRVGVFAAFVIFLAALAFFCVAALFLRPRPKFDSYWTWFERPANFCNFVESLFETAQALRRGGLLAVAPAAPGFPEIPPSAPRRPERTPNIILIMNESTFPPWLYQSAALDDSLAKFFRSLDGRMHGLRVEIYGGASWRSEFSVLTGIPSSCYGAFGTHVFRWAANKIHASLPHRLKQLGYRTALINPLDENFIGSAEFYRSISIDEILGMSALGASTDRESDEFYLNAAVDWFSRHADSQPGFLFMSTMRNHYPHDVRYVDEGDKIRAEKISDTEFDEYLRRLRDSSAAYENFRSELGRRYPDREFLIVHFGDHQPPLTSQLRNAKLAENGATAADDPELLYQTYFAIDAVNFEPLIDPELPDTIEVAYLGTVLLDAAGVAADRLQSARQELMMKNNGKLFFAEGQVAAQLNHRMLRAGIISPH